MSKIYEITVLSGNRIVKRYTFGDYMEALDMLDILEDENIQNDSGYTIEFRDMNYYSSGRRQ